ncbi:MAG: hypothetical protein UW32_C0001G0398 [Candidatus Wolfebacteria bacterium GW2011_GWE2_44_13]|uniref:Uncharacterized protein n=1 Tax=Candidatus Wolfebacteria bacterium GW2011_GWE2_44_13 TaxID=1619017 RepID=A0A0G1H8W0_9BACT|nr:MAG: hypothetical protein UW32_C0001G0398 [Candidatus Wolfebacteria bacterium GW2011_GWE2_44_13]
MLAVATLTGCAATKDRIVYVAYNPAQVGQAAVQQPQPSQPAAAAPQKEVPRYAAPVPGRHYLDIGVNPVNENRPLGPGERLLTLAEDAEVVTQSRKGTISRGWLRAGEQVFAVLASDPRYWEVVAIKRCGNPILNRAHGVGPVWILENKPAPVAQPVVAPPPAAVKALPPVIVGGQQAGLTFYQPAGEEPVPLCEGKDRSRWGPIIGGLLGLGVGVATHNPLLGLAISGGGSLAGAYSDGCIDPNDAMIALFFAGAGYGLTQPSSSGGGGSNSGGPAQLPGNGGGGPGGVPGG